MRDSDTTTCRDCHLDAEEARKLRRRYATATLFGLCACPTPSRSIGEIVERAWLIADEMMKVDDGRWIK